MTAGAASPLCPVFTHPRCLDHSAGLQHPESPARLRSVLDALSGADPGALGVVEPPPLDLIERVHPREYLDRLAAVSAAGGGALDPDTRMNEWSWEAALGAAGAAIAAIRSALAGQPAFAAVRPPGHHALREAAMGFCLLANAVIAAREAQEQGAERVLILDWDVHHGNGTQALVETDPTIRFISLHQWPHWPFSGAVSERGVGNVFNLPMRAGLDPSAYVEAVWSAVERATADWLPNAIVISAGFDSMRGDVLGGFTLEAEHYAEWVARIRTRFPEVPVAATLEGGYVPSRLAAGVVATCRSLA